MKKITILGSTGSIGKNTLQVIAMQEQKFKIHALVANQNIKLLAEQAKYFKPAKVVINDFSKYLELKELLIGENIEILAGENAIIEVAAEKVDIVMLAIVGMVGIKPGYSAIKAANNLAIANKESIVAGGDFLLLKAQETGSKIIPVDSEHNSLFHLLNSQKAKVEKLILTASGGPFLNYNIDQLQNITLDQALNHPKWLMGMKNSIDSATLINKGLELIEAAKLFNVTEKEIEVLIHPEAVIHALVELKDGSLFAHLSKPDMRLPISLAINYPDIQELKIEKLNLITLKSLNFFEPKHDIFPAINLARWALNNGGAAPLIYNIANEIAVEKFIQKELKFLDITKIVEKMLNRAFNYNITKFEDIFLIEEIIRNKTIEQIDNLKFIEV